MVAFPGAALAQDTYPYADQTQANYYNFNGLGSGSNDFGYWILRSGSQPSKAIYGIGDVVPLAVGISPILDYKFRINGGQPAGLAMNTGGVATFTDASFFYNSPVWPLPNVGASSGGVTFEPNNNTYGALYFLYTVPEDVREIETPQSGSFQPLQTMWPTRIFFEPNNASVTITRTNGDSYLPDQMVPRRVYQGSYFTDKGITNLRQVTPIVDGTRPTLQSVTSRQPNGTYRPGDRIIIDAVFSENVFLNVAQAVSNPVLLLNSGGRAAYLEGAGTPRLTFSYTVGSGQVTRDLDVTGVENHRAFKDRADNSMASPDVRPILPPDSSNLAGLKDLRIDGRPKMVSIDANVADGTYIVGDEIEITITFNEEVTPVGNPTLNLNSGGSAPYGGGSGSNALTFVYVVEEGESADDLAVLGLGLTSIDRVDDLDGARDSLSPSFLNFSQNLDDRRDISINAIAARVTDVYAIRPGGASVVGRVSDGTYEAGTVIDIEVEFDDRVFVDLNEGSIRLPLNTGGEAIYRDSATVSRGGEDVSRLTFRYTVGNGETSADLNNGAALLLRNAPYLVNIGPTLRDEGGNDVITDLATSGAASLGHDRAIVIADTSVPTITKVSSPRRPGSYYIGRTIPIEIAFSEKITVDTSAGSPVLTLNIEGVTAEYTGFRDEVVTLTYTVLAGHNSDDLDATELILGGAVIKDLSGNVFTDTASFPTGNDANSLASLEQLVISTNIASVSWVSGVEQATPYTSGDRVEVTVVFSEAVLGRRASGTENFPYLVLNAASDARAILAEGGSPDRAQTFYYTVQDGDFTDDLDVTALVLNGGTIETDSGGVVTLDIPSGDDATSLASRLNIRVDAIPPSVATITAADGTYTTGEEVAITVTFDEIVTVTTPEQVRLSLNVAGEAIYAGGSGTPVLTFTYTALAGENVEGLDVTGISAPENILDGAGNRFDAASLPTGGEENSLLTLRDVIIDTPPMVTGITTATPDGAYREGEIIDLEVMFSEVVDVTGAPDVPLNSGGVATYHSGTASDLLTFRYVVALGEGSGDLNNGAAIALNNGGIQDNHRNNLLLTLATSGAGALTDGRAILIDAIAPRVASISSPTADGTYKAGETVTIHVDFSEPVTLALNGGSGPILPLNSASDAAALFTSQTEISADGAPVSRLIFLYTVAAGENAVRLNTGAALALNNATIRDAIGHDGEMALPIAGTASLAGSAAIGIDNAPPVVTLSRAGTETVAGGEAVTVTFTFSEPVTDFAAEDISLEGSGATIEAASFQGSGTTYSVTLTAIASGAGSATVSIIDASYTDLVGNPGGPPETPLTFAVEAIRPTVTIAGPAGDFGTDYRGRPIGDFEVTIRFSEAVTGFAVAEDVSVTGASILGVAALTAQEDGTYLTAATLRPDEGRRTPITIAFAEGRVSDLVGNGNPAASLAITPALPLIYVSADASRVNEGNDAVFAVALSAPYLYPVTFWYEIAEEGGLSASDHGTATPAAPVVIAAGQTQARITVPTIDDSIVDNPGEGLRLQFSSSDPVNAALPETPIVQPYVSAFTITVIDDEAPGVTTDTDPVTAGVQTAALTVLEEDPAGAAYTVRLDARPPAGVVTVTVTAPAGLQVAQAGGTAAASTGLSFSTANWNFAQTVIVTAAGDDDGVGRTGLQISHEALGPGYTGLVIPDVPVTVEDDDIPALLVDTGDGPGGGPGGGQGGGQGGEAAAVLAVPEAGTASFTLRLTTAPTGPVTVTITQQTEGAASDPDLTASPPTLTFTTARGGAAGWDVPRTVIVSAADDADSRFGERRFTLTALGGEYGDVTAALMAEEVENDPPTVTIELGSGSGSGIVSSRETPIVNFILSAAADVGNPFDLGDITMTGDAVGTLSGFTGSGAAYTALFTPAPDVEGTATLSIADNAFAVRGVFSRATSQTIAVDTIAPVVIDLSADTTETLARGDTTTVTLTFSEPVYGLAGNVEVTGGFVVLASLEDGESVYMGDFTPDADFVGTATIIVTDVSYTDLAGNVAEVGALTPVAIAVDTVTPTVEITSDAGGTLVGGDRPTVTLTFSEAVTGFDIAQDVSVTGGQLRPASGSDGEAVYLATFTPAADFDGTATITLSDASYADLVGNPGDGGQLDGGLDIDTVRPSATLARADGGSGPVIGNVDLLISFSEAVTGFYSNDLAVDGGTVAEITGGGAIWTATIRPHRGYSGTLTIDLAAAAVTDAAGNPNIPADRLSVTAALPLVTISGLGAESVDEGENKRFRVAKPDAYPYDITLAFTVEPTGDGEAADFIPPDPLTVTFAADARANRFFNVRAVADLIRETGRTEGFRVTLSPPAEGAAYTLGPERAAVATIRDETREPYIEIGDSGAVDEGGTLSFALTADRANAFDVVMYYSLYGDGITVADVAGDGGLIRRSITMPANAREIAVEILTIDDDVDEGGSESEGAERLTIALLAGDNYKRSTATGARIGHGVIRDVFVPPPPDPEPEPDPEPDLILTMQDFFVPEDRNRVLHVSLAAQPSGDVLVETEHTEGDLSLRVDEGAALTFTTENWDEPRRISIFAAADAAGDSGSATFTVSASGGGYDGVAATFTAREEDDEAEAENHPTIAISRTVTGTLSRGNPAGGGRAITLTFALSAPPDTGTGLASDDISITGGEGGTLSAPVLAGGSGAAYTATFTAADNFQGTVQLAVRANAFQHNSASSQPAYYTIPVDTIGLPVDASDIFLALPNAYIDAPDSSGLQITNPETCCRRHITRGQSFTAIWLGGSANDGVGGADLIQVDLTDFGLVGPRSLLTVQDAGIFNGAATTYEGITLTASDDYGLVFTVPQGAPENPRAQVRMRMRDEHGNYGPWETGAAYAILDNSPPVVTITSDAAGDLIQPGEAATITFSFSEPVRAFDMIAEDIRIADPLSGAFSNLVKAGNEETWRATFTANAEYEGRTTFDVIAGGAGNYEDYAGLRGAAVAATPLTFTINRDPVVVSLAHASGLTSGIIGAFDVAITFSEPVTDFDDAAEDITVTNGSATELIGSGTDYVATIRPANAHTGDVSVAIPPAAANDVLGFGNVAAPPITVLVALPAALASPVADAVNEGQPAQFTLSLDAPYPWPVTVAYEVAGTQGAVAGSDFTAPSATSAIFYPGDVARTVTVETLDDTAADAAGEGIRLTVLGESADNYIPGGLAATVALTDNEVPGLTVSPPSLTIDEGGAEASYTIVLNAAPAMAVTVTASAEGEVRVAAGGGVAAASVDLIFTTMTGQPASGGMSGWDVPQTVTVRAGADDDGGDDLAVITHTTGGGDPFYDSTLPASQRPGVAVTVIDDDVAALVVDTDLATPGTQTGALIILEDSAARGDVRGFTVALGAEPTAEVVVTIVPEPVSAGGDPDLTASAASLTFTTSRDEPVSDMAGGPVGGWNILQTVIIHGADDADQLAGMRRFTITARGGDYEGFSRIVTVFEQENDGPTVGFTPPATTMLVDESTPLIFTLSEAESDQFTLGDIVVTDGNGAAVPGTLTGFTGSGASYRATFTPPPGFEGVLTISVPAGAFTSDSTDIASVAAVRSVTVDTLAPVATISSGAVTMLNAGAVAEITITFSEDVVGFEAADIAATGGTLTSFSGSGRLYRATFTPAVDSTAPGIVEIAASADHRDGAGNIGDRDAALTPPLAIDTEAPRVTITSDASGVQGAGGMVTVTFSFSEPVTGFEFVDVEAFGGTLAPASFQSADAGATYSVSFITSEDFAGFGDVAIKSTADYADLAGNAGPLGVSLDTPFAINSSRPTATLTRTDGGTGAVVGDFDVTLSFSEAVLGTPDFSIGPGAAMVGGVRDVTSPEGGPVWQISVRPDAGYSGAITIDVGADTVTDALGNGNQAAPQLSVTAALPTVSVAAAAMSVNEGQPAQFTLSLDAAYPWPVTAGFAVSGSGATVGADFTLPPAPASPVVFAPGETGKSVTVQTIDDVTTDGPDESITFTLASATNAGVAGPPANVASVLLQDDDQPGLTVSTTALSVAEGGSGAAYTLKLNTQPDADVVITVTASGDARVATGGAAAASSVDLTFTGAGTNAWDVPQSVSVTAVDDESADDETAALTHSVTTSADGYGSLDEAALPDVMVAISDDDEMRLIIDTDPDTPGVQTGELRVPEDSQARGETRRFTVTLGSQPLADVGFEVTPQAVSAGGDPDLTARADSPLFRTTRGGANGWDVPRIVHIDAGDDADRVDGDRRFTITATGGDYDGLSGVVTATEEENDGPTITLFSLPTTPMLIGETVLITFILSEDEDDEFDASDVLITDSEGTLITDPLRRFVGRGFRYAIVFTPPVDYEGILTLTVPAGAFMSDLNGLANEAVSGTFPVDTLAPTVTLTRRGGGTASQVGAFDLDISFSSEVSGFSLDDDLLITNGSAFGTAPLPSDPDGDGIYETSIRIRPDVGYAGPLTITMAAGAVRDLAGNDNVAATVLGVPVALPLVTLSGPPGITEGESATFTVSLNAASPYPLTIPFTVTPAMGGAAADIVPPATLSVDFAAGDVADKTITVAIVDDAIDEADTESVTVALTPPPDGAAYRIGAASGVTVSITDNDDPIVDIANAADVIEGGTLSFPVTVTRTLVGVEQLAVNYRLSGPDISADDFAAGSLAGSAVISATMQALQISTIDDDIDEGTGKIVFVTLEDGAGYRIASAGVMPTGIMIDNDERGIAVSTATLHVPEAGSAAFTVALTSQPSAEVQLAIMAEEAGDPDLTASPPTLTFSTARGGATGWDVARTVTVSAADDADRIAGTNRLTIDATGGDYNDLSETVMAREQENDGPTVTFSVPASVMAIGESALLTFTLSEAEGREFDSADIQVTDSTGVALPGTVTGFGGGGASYRATFTPPARFEGSVTITVAAGAFNADTTGLASIASAGDVAIDTLAPGVTLMRSDGESGTVIGDFDLDLGFSEAVSGFRAHTALTIRGGSVEGNSFPPRDTDGDGTYETTVRIRPDQGYAGPVSVRFVSGGVTDLAGNGNPALVTLTVPVALPVVTLVTPPAAHVIEGADATVTVRSSAAYPHRLTIPFSVTPASGAAAADIMPPATLSVDFAPNDVADKTIIVGIVDDAEDEADTESVIVTLTPPELAAGYTLGAIRSVGTTITDNDERTISIASATAVTEGGTLSFPVTVTRPLIATDQLTVNYRLSGAGIAADDLAAGSLVGSAVISPTQQALQIATANDRVDEGAHETLTVTLEAGAGYEIAAAGGSATGAINDDDEAGLRLSPTALTVPEGGAAMFTVVLTAEPSGPVTVETIKASGDVDLTVNAGASFSFTPGDWESAQSVTIAAAEEADGDFAAGTASFTVSASGGGYGGVTTNLVATEQENDAPTVAISGALDGDRVGAAGVSLTFTLSAAPTSGSFGADDINVANAGISGFAGGGTSYTLTLVPQADGPVEVSVRAAAFSVNGRDNSATPPLTFTGDVTLPTLSALTIGPPDRKAREAATITFTFSEEVVGFEVGDIAATGGTLTGFSGAGAIWRVTFTPAANSMVAGRVRVKPDASYSDLAGNAGPTGGSTPPIAVDTVSPRMTEIMAVTPDGAYKAGDIITIAVIFDESVTVTGSPLLTLNSGSAAYSSGSGTDRLTFTHTVGPGENVADLDATALTLGGGTIADSAGNAAIPTLPAATLAEGAAIVIDTQAPVVTLARSDGLTSDIIGDFGVTFTLSEALDGASLTEADVTVSGGSVVAGSLAGGGLTRTLTIRPDDGQSATVTVTVAADAVMDAAGNGNAVVRLDVGAALATVSLVASVLSVVEGTTATFTISIAAPYPYPVTVPFTITGENGARDGTDSATDDFTSPASLVVIFPAGAVADRVVSVRTIDDEVADAAGEGVTLTLGTLSNAKGAGGTATVTLTDNDIPGFTITPTEFALDEGGTARYTVTPDTRPTAPVTVMVRASGAVEVDGGATALLTFAANVAASQTVIVSAPDDEDARDGSATITHSSTSTDPAYNALPGLADVRVTITDDDVAGLAFSGLIAGGTILAVPEPDPDNPAIGGSASISVTLTSRPQADVTLSIAKDAGGDADLRLGPTPADRIITAADWKSDSVTFTILALRDTPPDTLAGTADFTVTASSTDSDYSTTRPFTARELDSDGPSVAISGVAAGTTVKIGERPTLTFTLTEDARTEPGDHQLISSDFSVTAEDGTVLTGRLSPLSPVTGLIRTATFTPPPGYEGQVTIALAGDVFRGETSAVFNGPAQLAIAVDTLAPAMERVSSLDGDATYKAGETVTLQLAFSEPVTVDTSGGTPSLTLSTGARAQYSSGGGSDLLSFTYEVAADDPETDALDVAALTLNDGVITDSAGNVAATALPAAGSGRLTDSATVAIDVSGPRLIAITATPTRLRAGETATITARFDEPVTGLVATSFTTAGGTLGAFTPSGNPASYEALFTPDALVTQADGGITGLAVPVTYSDAANNPGSAVPGGSARFPVTIAIDTAPPTPTFSTMSVSGVGAVTLTLSFGEAVDGFTASDITLTGDPDARATVAAVGGSEAEYTVTVTPGDGAVDAITVSLAAGVVSDKSGNPNPASAGAVVTPILPLVSVAATRPSVNEGDPDPVASFTISIDAPYPYPVTVPFSVTAIGAGSGADFTAPPALSVTFAAGERAAKTVRVAIIDDATAEPDAEGLMLTLEGPGSAASNAGFGAASSASAGAGATPNYRPDGTPAEVMIIDDDTPGVRITAAPTLTVAERRANGAGGTSARYTIGLNSWPEGAPVAITVMAEPPAQVAVGSGPAMAAVTLTFPAGSGLERPPVQTVRVTGAHDLNAVTDMAQITHSLSAPGEVSGYDGLTVPAEIAVTITDSDAVGLVVDVDPATPGVQRGGLTLMEADGAAGAKNLALWLTAQPSGGPVTVDIALSGEAVSIVDPTTRLTFTTVTGQPVSGGVGGWDVPQVITLIPADDEERRGRDATLTLTAGGADYAGVMGRISLSVTDDDVPGVMFSDDAAPLTITEEAAGVGHKIRLNTRPASNVVMRVSVLGDEDVRVADADASAARHVVLTFTPVTWGTLQTVTVTAENDADIVDDEARLTYDLTSDDPDYAAIEIAARRVTVRDNAVGPVVALPAGSGASSAGEITLSDPAQEARIDLPVPVGAGFPRGAADAAIIILPPGHNTGAGANVAVRAAPETDTGDAKLAVFLANAHEPGQIIVQYTPTGEVTEIAVGEATVCIPLAAGERGAGAGLYRANDAPGSAWEGPLPEADPPAGESGVICGKTDHFSHFQLGITAGLSAIEATGVLQVSAVQFASAVAVGLLDMVAERVGEFRAGMRARASLSLAGEQINFARTGRSKGADAAAEVDAVADTGGLFSEGFAGRSTNPYQARSDTGAGFVSGGAGFESRPVSDDDFRQHSAFDLTAGSTDGARAGSGGGDDFAVSLWGRMQVSGFQDEPNADLDVSGTATSVHLGADYARDEWMAGVGISWTEGDGDFTRAAGGAGAGAGPASGADLIRGDLDMEMVTLYPYAALNMGEDMSVWITGGLGSGMLRESRGEAGSTEVDLDFLMVAAGATREVWRDGDRSLNLKGDARGTRVETGAAMDATGTTTAHATASTISQLRFGVEGQLRREMAQGGQLTTSLEAMLRSDGGDARKGVGVGLGGAVSAEFPDKGLRVTASGRLLAAHSDRGAADWSLALEASYDPGVAGEGGYVNLAPQYGAAASADTVWQQGASVLSDDLHGAGDDLRFSFETGYRFPDRRVLGRFAPYLGYEGGPDGGVIRFGSHIRFPSVDLGVEARGHFSDAGDETGDLWLRGSLRF